MRPRKNTAKKRPRLQLRLYVSDHTPRSQLAIANLEKLCENYLQKGYSVRLIDIHREPGPAVHDNILATPTLVRAGPGPMKKVIGCLSDVQAVLRGLDLHVDSDVSSPRKEPIVLVQKVGSA